MSQSPKPPPLPTNWNPVVIAVIGIACIVFLILSYYRILRRHCLSLGGTPPTRVQRQNLLNEENLEDPSLQFQSRGLDSSIVYCLPTIQYHKSKPDEAECVVCLGVFEQGDWLKFLPNCSHSFHIACIDTWFLSHSNCPICRSNVIHNLALFETLSREDAIQETATTSQALHFPLQNSSQR